MNSTRKLLLAAALSGSLVSMQGMAADVDRKTVSINDRVPTPEQVAEAMFPKEIQALINESASNIGRGAGLMQSASKTIEQVVQSVAHVNTLMGQMGVAAREQAEGILQVNEAVTLLDRDTQQNAALAEQSAAASRVMSDSAAVLGRTLEVFRVR